jgi:hypothetical protein
MDLKIGTPLQVRVDPRQNKNLSVAAGLVTRVLDDEEDRVNVRVFLDTGMDLRLTSLKVVDSEPDPDDKDIEKDVSGTQQVAWVSQS